MNFFAVDETFEELIVINKSKFITTLVPINSQQEAIEQLKKINKKYSDATHNCYAYISNEIATEQRFSDDGEPQGTAGIPMLEVLKKKNVYMTLAVITRYFGGIKLGANGLVTAYSSCLVSAIEHAKIVEYKQSDNISVTCEYSIYKKIEEAIEGIGGQIENIVYNEGVQIDAIVPIESTKEIETQIADISLGKSKVCKNNTKYNKFIK